MYTWGLIGLATMGQNLARNFATKGISIAVYNRTSSVLTDYVGEYGSEQLKGFPTLSEFIANIAKPRKVILLVKAGEAVDEVIKQLTPLLEPGDILLDGGNSFYQDTARRELELKAKNIHYIGIGVSGGAEGALNGPSMMPGGDKAAIESILPDLQKVAAADFSNGRAVAYMGPAGAGHFVKMVHNGIEYAQMQGITEVYDFLRAHGYTNQEMSAIFGSWNSGEMNSYLLEITQKILQTKTAEGSFLVDLILDTAENKGTGKWTAQTAMDLGVPAPTLAEALFSRYATSRKERRVELSKLYPYQPTAKTDIDLEALMQILRTVYLLSYYQGMEIIKAGSAEYKWEINLGEVCRIWQGGCIIRSTMLRDLLGVYSASGDQLESEYFQKLLRFNAAYQTQYQKVATSGLAINVIASAHNYLLAMTAANSPANLIQAQRDFFGQHTYLRTDKEGEFTGGWG